MSYATTGLICLLSIIHAAGFAQELPQPRVITAPPDAPPSDAIVLFNGTDLAQWEYAGNGGVPESWKLENGAVIVGSTSIVTKQNFGDIQLHVEWATPPTVAGDGQGRGNSGVYLMGRYEVQVLDSWQNPTYADGSAGAIYKQYPPLVNASRKPGEWQTYDIIFHAPELSADGGMQQEPTITVLHNGVLIQDNVVIHGTGTQGSMKGNRPKGPILLQNHKNPVRYRNIWVRELP